MVDQSSLTSPCRKIGKVASASTFDNQIEGSPTQNRHVAQEKSIGKLNRESPCFLGENTALVWHSRWRHMWRVTR